MAAMAASDRPACRSEAMRLFTATGSDTGRPSITASIELIDDLDHAAITLVLEAIGYGLLDETPAYTGAPGVPLPGFEPGFPP
jgi:hypothetical protein